MDQHPIPQDVTGFQFKLIGTMTVKQFGYVASGVILAVVLYYLPLHFSALTIVLKVILVPFFGASGVIVAFVPLEGRPIDVMATNFAKALFSPNQYIYHRQGKRLSFEDVAVVKAPVAKKTNQKETPNHVATPTTHHDEKGEKLRALLLSSHDQAKNAMDKKEAAFLDTLSMPAVQATASPAQSVQGFPKSATPTPVETSPVQPPVLKPMIQPLPQLTPPPAPKLEPQKVEEKNEPTVANLNSPMQPSANTVHPNSPEHKVTVLSQQINDIHAQKQQLEQELNNLKTQLATHKETPVLSATPFPTSVPTPVQSQVMPKPTPMPTPQPTQTTQDPSHVHTISQDNTKKVGLPHVSDSPNVVVGIVKDPRGNILPNILVEVKDKDGNPVRAFKTNQLGQFASATPLSTGTYTMELDDPKKLHRFDIIQVTANNTVLLPIEVISHDAREELRKQLFAN